MSRTDGNHEGSVDDQWSDRGTLVADLAASSSCCFHAFAWERAPLGLTCTVTQCPRRIRPRFSRWQDFSTAWLEVLAVPAKFGSLRELLGIVWQW